MALQSFGIGADTETRSRTCHNDGSDFPVLFRLK
jgi:hypothetical protein